MTVLVPLLPEQFTSFAAAVNGGYAQDNVVTGRWIAAEAPARARAEFEQLLPQGLGTPDHRVLVLRDDATGDDVGFLWFAAVGVGEARAIYVFNISVHPPFRRRGHAQAALAWLETHARAEGLGAIRLNVFAHNPTAQALYGSLGYEVTAMTMRKTLPAAEAAVNAVDR